MCPRAPVLHLRCVASSQAEKNDNEKCLTYCAAKARKIDGRNSFADQ